MHTEDDVVQGYRHQEDGPLGAESNSFLEYTQQQMSVFSADMTVNMSRVALFTNMEGNATCKDLHGATVY